MLSYQHLYHAGNAADVHKHLVLAGLLGLLTVKDRPLTYMDSHAGRGLYDLGAPEALKTGEAALGIGRLSGGDHPYFGVLDRIRARHGPRAYPGSPLIARAMLRPQDRLHLMELHPAEHAGLRAALAGPGVAIHRRDGFEGVLALSPPVPRRGLVLCDPSYEVKSDYAAAAAFGLALMAKWPEAVLMIWYPVLPENRHRNLLAGLAPLSPLVRECGVPHRGRGMLASGIALINAPHGAGAVLAAAPDHAGGILSPAKD
jgi:23S rRNA (adenine2030-N6)-methyltransferase